MHELNGNIVTSSENVMYIVKNDLAFIKACLPSLRLVALLLLKLSTACFERLL